jgi:hypothetical protein
MGLVRTSVSEERIASFFGVEIISEIITNVVSSSLILSTLKIEEVFSSETSAPTRPTRCELPEDGILHDRRETLKF